MTIPQIIKHLSSKENRKFIKTNWAFLVGTFVLTSYICYLLVSIFNSQLALRQSNLDTWKLDIDKRAISTSYYFSERKYDAQKLLISKEIFNYFVNKELGMSEAYGLKVNLFLIKNLFNMTLVEKTIHGKQIYERIAFADSSGKLLVDTEKLTHSGQEDELMKYLEHEFKMMPIMMIEAEDQPRSIILSQPYFFKNNYAGQLLIWIAAQPLFDYLDDVSTLSSTTDIRIGDKNNRFIKSGNISSTTSTLIPGSTFFSVETYQKFQIPTEDGKNAEIMAIRVPINNTPFSLVSFVLSEELYKQSDPWKVLITTGFLAIIILIIVGVMLLIKIQNIILKTRYDEATKQSGLLQQKNIQLENEIELRKKIEQELRVQQAEIEKQKDELKQAMDKVYTLAYHDTLTGLPNRELFYDRLLHALALAKREGSQLALFFLDLDDFKDINDTLGHSSGDLLLQEVADRLKACLRKSDTIARWGGDEFVILLDSIKNVREVDVIVKKILDSLDKRFNIVGHELFTSTSIGIAIYPDDAQDSMTLLKHADIAMYAAKDKGRHNYQFFAHELNENALKRRELEISLRQAIQNKEFFLVYQPQVNIINGKIIGLEALLRWNHPEKGIIYPDEFITLTEEMGLISPVGDWVTRAVCTQMMSWRDLGFSGFRVAVNITGRQFHQATFIEMVNSVLQETRLPPDCLELEFTESTLMSNAQENIQKLKELKALGIKIAIDDFGTGYSSLSYLKNFPIDLVKIDKSFIHDISLNSNDAAIVRAIVAMTQSLGIDVLAEGVETELQVYSLIAHNCVKMQGYHFSRPRVAEEIIPLLQRTRSPG